MRKTCSCQPVGRTFVPSTFLKGVMILTKGSGTKNVGTEPYKGYFVDGDSLT